MSVTDHGAPAKRSVALRTDAGIVGDLELELAAGETARRVVSIRPVPGTWIEATLEGATTTRTTIARSRSSRP